MTVTKYITAGNLAKVMEIPVEMQNSLLEVTVRLAENQKKHEKEQWLSNVIEMNRAIVVPPAADRGWSRDELYEYSEDLNHGQIVNGVKIVNPFL